MTLPINILPAAQADIFQAIDWYDSCQPGLGRNFETEVLRMLRVIAEFPKVHARIDMKFRRAVIQEFPYIVVYRNGQTAVDILAVFPTHMNPDRLQGRLG